MDDATEYPFDVEKVWDCIVLGLLVMDDPFQSIKKGMS